MMADVLYCTEPRVGCLVLGGDAVTTVHCKAPVLLDKTVRGLITMTALVVLQTTLQFLLLLFSFDSNHSVTQGWLFGFGC